MRSTVDARSRISNRDLIVDKITSIIADQIDKTLICQVHIGVLTLKLGLGDARPQHRPAFRNFWISSDTQAIIPMMYETQTGQ